MRTSNIGTIVSTAITLGMINYRTMIEPASDKIKQREAKRYLTKLGYKPSVLENMKDAGLIHRRKGWGWQQSYLLFCKGVTEGSSNVSYPRGRTEKQIIYGKLRNF